MDTPKIPESKNNVSSMSPSGDGKPQSTGEEKTRARTASQRKVVPEDTTPSKKLRPILPKGGLSTLTAEAPLSLAKEKEKEKKLKNRVIHQRTRDSEKEKVKRMEEQLGELERKNEALENENRELKVKVQQLETENERIKISEADSYLTKRKH